MKPLVGKGKFLSARMSVRIEKNATVSPSSSFLYKFLIKYLVMSDDNMYDMYYRKTVKLICFHAIPTILNPEADPGNTVHTVRICPE